MDYNEFANSIKQKYPQYNSVDNLTLAKKMIEKYPQYASKVKLDSTNTATPNKGIGQKILDAGTKVANFVGAKGISDQFGADIARSRLPDNQKNFIQYPSMKEVVGSAIQTGANFIPGAGKGAGLAAKIALGGATGYAFDVGSKLQDKNKTVSQSLVPGVGTAVGVALPIAGKLLGNLSTKGTEKLANNLEQSNLRLTPKDRSFIEKSDNGFIKWLADKKVVGNPEQRYQKISQLYDDLENQVQSKLKNSGATITKDEFIKAVSNIPENFIDDPQLYDTSQGMVDKLIKVAQEKYGNEIPLDFVNSIKRNYGKRAFDKAAQEVTNESSYEISQNLYDLIKDKIPELEKLNDEYSRVILAKKLMYKALGRSQLGIVGKIASSTAGGTIGNTIGGPVGAGVGIVAGEKLATDMFGTRSKSFVGSGAKKLSEFASKVSKMPTTSSGHVQISKKLLLNWIEQLQR